MVTGVLYQHFETSLEFVAKEKSTSNRNLHQWHAAPRLKQNDHWNSAKYIVRLVQTRRLTNKMTTGKEKIDIMLCTELQSISSAIDRVFVIHNLEQTPALFLSFFFFLFFLFFFLDFFILPSLSWTWRYRKPWNFVKLPKLFPPVQTNNSCHFFYEGLSKRVALELAAAL